MKKIIITSVLLFTIQSFSQEITCKTSDSKLVVKLNQTSDSMKADYKGLNFETDFKASPFYNELLAYYVQKPSGVVSAQYNGNSDLYDRADIKDFIAIRTNLKQINYGDFQRNMPIEIIINKNNPRIGFASVQVKGGEQKSIKYYDITCDSVLNDRYTNKENHILAQDGGSYLYSASSKYILFRDIQSYECFTTGEKARKKVTLTLNTSELVANFKIDDRNIALKMNSAMRFSPIIGLEEYVSFYELLKKDEKYATVSLTLYPLSHKATISAQDGIMRTYNLVCNSL